MNTYEQLVQAKELLDEGVITEEEFSEIKEKIISCDLQNNSNQLTLEVQNSPSASVDMEGATTGMKVLSFLIPIAGLILFIVDKDKKPNAAKDELMWGGIGFAIGLFLIMCSGA